MAPPTFGNLGEDAKNLLTKHYYFGVFNVKCSSATGDFNIVSNVNQNFKAKKLASDFEAKLKLPSYGATLSQKFTSDSLMNCDLTIEDKLLKNLKQTFSYSRKAFDGLSNATIKSRYTADAAVLDVDMFFKSAIPDISSSLVLSHIGYLGGLDMKVDSTSRSIQRLNLAIGYQVQDFAFHGLISNWGKCFAASVSQRLTDRVELAGSVSWSRDTDHVAWSVGSKYVLDEENKHFVKAKLDHLTRMSLSLTTYLTKGLQFTLCGMFNGPELPQLGLGFELEC
ncbi:Voltage-dependent anion-selective channel protein 2 [Paragonimus heterotremus]|uniref:Voltage-dependent anion-selective channel protein 2 n=1 Tax=Paragonimus heterotremus TaxID=100268 RepID=A0A8J4TB22_9TREM|nr:Voltage-dependent anion-selective channel protein 2 [Paragonimus heterotremus]